MSGIDASGLVTVHKHTRIRYGDRLIDFPFQKNIHQLPKEEFIDCLYDLFCTTGAPYETFKEMLYSKFGRSIAEKFLIPYNTKLYACDLDSLDKDAMGRFFPYADKEDIIRHFRQSGDGGYNDSFIYSRRGAIDFVRSFQNRLDPKRIFVGTEVVRIHPDRHVAILRDGTEIPYDRLVSTMPFPRLLDMCGIRYGKDVYSWNKVVVLNIGFDRKGNDQEDHWIYFPEGKYLFYRVGFYDNILSQDRMSLYVECGYAPDEPVPQESVLLERVLSDLQAAGIVSGEKVVDWQCLTMNPAYVHIKPESEADVREKKGLLARSDIYSIGRYGSWTYCSIEDNILEAASLAAQLNV